MFDKFAEIDKKKEALEKQKRPDAMNNIDQWNRFLTLTFFVYKRLIFSVEVIPELPVIPTALKLVET